MIPATPFSLLFDNDAVFEDMALRKVRSNLDRLFDKSLTDLIRGIRNNKDNEARYITACIEEIKQELRQDSIFVKANAIEKLAYLQMLGYDISWASFNVIEVMASTKYTEKRIGYLAASQSFHDETDVLMLTTNLIRKDLNSPNMYDSGVALGGLSCFVTPDLARDLAADIVNLLTSSRPYTRKRAVLLLYKIFLKYPESLRPTFPRLKEKLEDPDPGVQSAAVNVICELARKNPKNYLTLAPVFFKLMTTSSNNWMLIKIIKLFGALVPLEPRLGKKLLEPLTNLINSTSAMSLLYECINTVIAVLISISAGGEHTASIQLCVQKLGVLIEDSDQNLKYLGLLAMGKILKTHPKAVQAHKDIVLRCLEDKDESIRLRSLDLLYGMVSKKNIMEIVKKLMEHVELAEGSHYRDELLSRIVGICSFNNYQYITNFEWYISVLVELTKVEGTKHGAMIAEQIQDVTVRVESIRHFSVSQMALLVENANELLAGSVQQRSNICEVLQAAAWICGEYCQHVRNPGAVLESMLRAKTSVMPGHILSVYVQNIGKLYSFQLAKAEEDDDWDAIETLDNLMLSKLPQFELVEHLEAQERSCNLMCLLRIIESMHARKEKIGPEVAALFDGELNPVASKAQKKVPVPEGLDLDAWIGEPWAGTPDESSDESDVDQAFGCPAPRPYYNDNEHDNRAPEVVEGVKSKKKSKDPEKMTPEELERRRKQREQQIESNPYYVKGTATAPPKPIRPTRFTSLESQEANESAEIRSPLEIPGVIGLSRYMEQQESTLTWKKAKEEKTNKKEKKAKKTKGGKKGKKRRTVSTSSEEEVAVVHHVNRAEGEMPDGAKSTDDEDADANEAASKFKALDIDLDEPLRPEEILKGPVAYTRTHPSNRVGGPLIPRPPTIEPPQPYALPGSAEKPKKKKTIKKTEEGVEKKTKKKTKAAAVPAKTEEYGDMWLDEPSGTAENNVVGQAVDTIKKEKKTKTKKKLAVSREAYEEASGVCTPTNPNASGESPRNGVPAPAVAAGTLLGTNDDLTVHYTAAMSPSTAGEMLVDVKLSNGGGRLLTNVELNLVDTLNIRLIREGDTVILSPSVAPSESATSQLRLKIANVSQFARGSITYFAQDDDGTIDGKLDFRLSLRSTAFLSQASISAADYSELLAGDDIECTASASFASDVAFSAMLQHVTAMTPLTVVEKVANAASLYAQTMRSLPICVLVKKTGKTFQIDGKAGDGETITQIVNDLKAICSQ